MLTFEWDPQKNQTNIRKHGVSFQEARTVFYDPFARVMDDRAHSVDEERFLILGYSRNSRLLIVCHCIRGSEDNIRIISARKATRNEARQYHNLI